MRGLNRFRNKDADVMSFLRSLATLVSAGFPLARALDDCRELERNPESRGILARIKTHVESGYTFTQSLKMVPEFLPPATVALIAAGESAGTLPETLSEAADLMEQQYQSASEFTAALIYPAIVICISLAAVTFLSLSILPQIQQMYQSQGAELPFLSRMILSVMRTLTPIVIGVLIVLSVGAGIKKFRTRMQRAIQSLYRRIKQLSPIQIALETTLWSGMMHTLLRHGVHLIDSLEVVMETIRQNEMKDALMRIKTRVESGESPGDAFNAEPRIPALARRLIRAGDQSGTLADAFQRTAEFFYSEYRIRTRKLVTLAEPAAILFAGILVIIIALGVVLPLADLGGIIK